MVCIHHNKDMDGFSSGALVQLKYPECRLIGWDFAEPHPWDKLTQDEEIILIDLSFKPDDMIKLLEISGGKLTWIDHHVSPYKTWQTFEHPRKDEIKYIYQAGKAAVLVAWEHFFPGEMIPLSLQLLSDFDVWNQTDRWETAVLPFQFYMLSICNSAAGFPRYLFNPSFTEYDELIKIGKFIRRYQQVMDDKACQRAAFERSFEGLRAICINARYFGADTVASVYDPEKHDIMIGFEYTGNIWTTSLRSNKPEVDCSVIAKKRGGGGHKAAAGFETNTMEEIFEIKYEPKVELKLEVAPGAKAEKTSGTKRKAKQ